MKGYGAVGDARKRMLDGHENYSAEVWEERAQEQAHRASQAEVKYVALRKVLGNYFDFDADPWADDGACPEPEDVWRLHRDLKAALLTEGAE